MSTMKSMSGIDDGHSEVADGLEVAVGGSGSRPRPGWGAACHNRGVHPPVWPCENSEKQSVKLHRGARGEWGGGGCALGVGVFGGYKDPCKVSHIEGIILAALLGAKRERETGRLAVSVSATSSPCPKSKEASYSSAMSLSSPKGVTRTSWWRPGWAVLASCAPREPRKVRSERRRWAEKNTSLGRMGTKAGPAVDEQQRTVAHPTAALPQGGAPKRCSRTLPASH